MLTLFSRGEMVIEPIKNNRYLNGLAICRCRDLDSCDVPYGVGVLVACLLARVMQVQPDSQKQLSMQDMNDIYIV